MGAVEPLVCSSSLCRSHPHLDSLVFSTRSPCPQAEVAIQAVAEWPLEWYPFVIPLDVCPPQGGQQPWATLASTFAWVCPVRKATCARGAPGLTLLPWGTRPAS